MKSVLVPIGGSDTDASLFETALAAARPFSSHLNFLHIHVGPGQAAANTPHAEFAMGPALSNALRDFEAQAKARSAAAAQHFRDFCLRSSVEICDVPASAKGVTASWQAEGGHALRRIMFHARHNDLVVVGRAKTANGLPADFLEELLLGCGRPVLIASSAPARTPGADRHDHGVLEGERRSGARGQCSDAVPDPRQARRHRQRRRNRREPPPKP